MRDSKSKRNRKLDKGNVLAFYNFSGQCFKLTQELQLTLKVKNNIKGKRKSKRGFLFFSFY